MCSILSQRVYRSLHKADFLVMARSSLCEQCTFTTGPLHSMPGQPCVVICPVRALNSSQDFLYHTVITSTPVCTSPSSQCQSTRGSCGFPARPGPFFAQPEIKHNHYLLSALRTNTPRAATFWSCSPPSHLGKRPLKLQSFTRVAAQGHPRRISGDAPFQRLTNPSCRIAVGTLSIRQQPREEKHALCFDADDSARGNPAFSARPLQCWLSHRCKHGPCLHSALRTDTSRSAKYLVAFSAISRGHLRPEASVTPKLRR